ncbi:hypothetical protein IMZ48_25700 [Candidatus Bathyarchaeota archaeon]|nr:hypothetical protein [Candidatus Bathyarchaeota archaeon]
MYPTKEGPQFVKGHAVSMGLVAMSSVIYIFFLFYFRYQNKRRAAGKLDYKTQGMTEEEVDELGEDNPRFRYTY